MKNRTYVPMMMNSLQSVTALSRLGWSWWLEHRWLPLQNLAGMSTAPRPPSTLQLCNPTSITSAAVGRSGPGLYSLNQVFFCLCTLSLAWNKLSYCLPSWSQYTDIHSLRFKMYVLYVCHSHTLPLSHDTAATASVVVIKNTHTQSN